MSMQAEPSTVGVSFMTQQTKQPPKETKDLGVAGNDSVGDSPPTESCHAHSLGEGNAEGLPPPPGSGKKRRDSSVGCCLYRRLTCSAVLGQARPEWAPSDGGFNVET